MHYPGLRSSTFTPCGRSGVRVLAAAFLLTVSFSPPCGESVLAAPVLKTQARGDGSKPKGSRPKGSRPRDRWKTLTEGLALLRAQFRPAVVVFDAATADVGGGYQASWGRAALEARTLSGALKPYVLIRVTAGELSGTYPIPTDLEEFAGAGGGAPGTGPAGTGPAGTGPAGTGPAGTGPAGTGPAGTGPAGTEPAGTGPAPVPTVGEVLGFRDGEPAVVILDLRERIVRFYDRASDGAQGGGADDPAKKGQAAKKDKARRLPRSGRLRRQLKQIAKVNFVFAKEAYRVEPLLEKARYSHAAGDSRAAVSIVRELEPQKAQMRMDPILKEKIAGVIAELREAAEQALARAEALESQRRHFKAMDAFDKAAFDFPFKDIAVRAIRRSGDILRKVSFGK